MGRVRDGSEDRSGGQSPKPYQAVAAGIGMKEVVGRKVLAYSYIQEL
jgi:hypothetical protein